MKQLFTLLFLLASSICSTLKAQQLDNLSAAFCFPDMVTNTQFEAIPFSVGGTTLVSFWN